jgi:hypothetical protein
MRVNWQVCRGFLAPNAVSVMLRDAWGCAAALALGVVVVWSFWWMTCRLPPASHGQQSSSRLAMKLHPNAPLLQLLNPVPQPHGMQPWSLVGESKGKTR